ncbi:PEP/pyruvate-binding domain-containing protein [Streptomyces sp. NPDC079020]|uniref:PEP/pyruvate-binding domain-containing protein n=1 Tax=Streptomyces sp. NPDC079020 TaxID=3365722 RepID=UPI0037D4B809
MGGKNASLGEMANRLGAAGIRVPPGFATTAEAYEELLAARAHAAGRPAGLCGQRPSDDPAFTAILVAAGLDSISVAPDSFAAVKSHVARAEATLKTDA